MTYEELWNKFINDNKAYAECDYSVYNYEDDDLKDILDGKKCSEVSLYDSFINAHEPLPVKGDVAVILDMNDNAICVIEDKAVELMPFSSAKNKEDLRASAVDEGIAINDETITVVEKFEVIYK